MGKYDTATTTKARDVLKSENVFIAFTILGTFFGNKCSNHCQKGLACIHHDDLRINVVAELFQDFLDEIKSPSKSQPADATLNTEASN